MKRDVPRYRGKGAKRYGSILCAVRSFGAAARTSDRSYVLIALIALVAAPALAQSGGRYVIKKSTIDGGSARVTGGEYVLTGTFGQPDAGAQLTDLQDSRYELMGGFWFARAPGNCNSDPGVDLLDHRSVVACMAGSEPGPLSPQCSCFDLNRNETVDLADFALFGRAFSGG